jgi:mRNA-degrading endonuclease RelE of RelBE toxin-antitoxin system
MRFEIELAPQAARSLRALLAHLRSEVRALIETHLRHEPMKISRGRIKRLRGLAKPQFRLRIDEMRVFYDVREQTVEVLAIVEKEQAQRWLAEQGTPNANRGTGEVEG